MIFSEDNKIICGEKFSSKIKIFKLGNFHSVNKLLPQDLLLFDIWCDYYSRTFNQDGIHNLTLVELLETSDWTAVLGIEPVTCISWPKPLIHNSS